ncbi:phosphodiesterase [Salinibacterium sp. dk2585]|uniref:phosphodiesterase n=1 Tax=unclassified Salinibacterium TaxID=2632331 RepID=UPI0011C24ACA|nr:MULTISPECIES: phosphodiesterase [unclassified Salinibacterium]QEE61591.1 phosphodiesterase [Salinibacterium sp. dk2585]TXK52440.1 phosphodiesterase [Salinibacterium sp. dk5596]
MTALGQHPDPSHVIAHISDTHLLAGGRRLYDAVDTAQNLERALVQLERSDIRPEALVFTGDLADLGEPEAYATLKDLVEPVAERLGAQVIWVMGNHDERYQYSEALFGNGSEQPQDRVYDINGLRIVSLDTTVPGYHHGELTDEQLEWLAEELARPAAHGTLIAVHHPPIPTPLLWAMQMLELHDQHRFANVVEGTDVRGILAGHLHYSSHSTVAGIPVSVAAATCYTLDLSARERLLSGRDSAQSMNIVHTYPDRVVHSLVPIGASKEISGVDAKHRAQIEAMTPEQRIAMFSKKDSPFNLGTEPAR